MKAFRELLHGGDIVTFEQCFGNREYIDFSANLNPLGQPESVRLALRNCAEACARYPDPLCRGLKSAIAHYESIPDEYIVCGNGAADIIYRIALGLRPKTALIAVPTFSEYERAISAAGCEIRFHTLCEEQDFALSEAIIEAIPGSGIMFLCNPNNPTGILIDADLLQKIVSKCEKCGTILVVDECFLDFLPDGGERSLKKRLSQNSNLILLKAFTKMFALPGVRLGYGLTANAGIREAIERVAAPWSVSVTAQLCGIAAAKELEFVQKTREMTAVQRCWLEAGLLRLGLKVFKGTANYLMFKSDEKALAKQLAERGIIIRDCGGLRGLAPGYYRVAVRTRQENEKLLAAISLVLTK